MIITHIGKYVINFDYLAYAIDDEEIDDEGVKAVILVMATRTRVGHQIVLTGADRDTFFEIIRHEYNRKISIK